MDTCIGCGKEVKHGGYSVNVRGFTVRPLCPDCLAACSNDSNKFVDEHRAVFERLLSERQQQLASVEAQVVSSDMPPRSKRETKLTKRYGDAYTVADGVVKIGKIIKIIGVVTSVLMLLAMLSLGSLAQERGGSAYSMVPAAIILAAMTWVSWYGLGTVVVALGQLLLASLDSAVNSSPFLSNELRAEIMSV